MRPLDLLEKLELAKSHINWLWDLVEENTRLKREGSEPILSSIAQAIEEGRKEFAPIPPEQRRWQCPHCKSRNVQVGLPAWHYESKNYAMQYVETDEEAEIMWWYCEDCNESDSGCPETSEDVVEEQLCKELEEFCKTNKLPWISADELIHEELTDEQRRWVSDFIVRWDAFFRKTA